MWHNWSKRSSSRPSAISPFQLQPPPSNSRTWTQARVLLCMGRVRKTRPLEGRRARAVRQVWLGLGCEKEGVQCPVGINKWETRLIMGVGELLCRTVNSIYGTVAIGARLTTSLPPRWAYPKQASSLAFLLTKEADLHLKSQNRIIQTLTLAQLRDSN